MLIWGELRCDVLCFYVFLLFKNYLQLLLLSFYINQFIFRYMNGQPQQPPPPYTAPYESFTSRRDLSTLHGSSPYGLNQCSIHRIQNCHCMQVQCKVEVRNRLNRNESPKFINNFNCRECRRRECHHHIHNQNHHQIH